MTRLDTPDPAAFEAAISRLQEIAGASDDVSGALATLEIYICSASTQMPEGVFDALFGQVRTIGRVVKEIAETASLGGSVDD